MSTPKIAGKTRYHHHHLSLLFWMPFHLPVLCLFDMHGSALVVVAVDKLSCKFGFSVIAATS
jgi:hypothetical protein